MYCGSRPPCLAEVPTIALLYDGWDDVRRAKLSQEERLMFYRLDREIVNLPDRKLAEKDSSPLQHSRITTRREQQFGEYGRKVTPNSVGL